MTAKPGAAYFSSALSFDIVRGGHLDLTILGALEVSITGDIANWMVPGKMVKGMGGAMDLVACQSKVIVAMEHSSKNGPKLLDKCTLPLTATGVVSMVVTEKAVFENRNGRLVLTEVAKDSSVEDVQAHTGFKLEVADNLKTF